MTTHPRQQWFIDRIGKVVWRNKTTCECEPCERVYQNGLLLLDEEHATYISELEGIYTAEGSKLRYFDTKQERDEWEKPTPKDTSNWIEGTDPYNFKKKQ